MAYLVDSDLIIDHLGNVTEARNLLRSLIPESAYMSVVTYMEAYQGTIRAPDTGRALDELNALVEDVPVLIFDEAIAIRCAQLRDDLIRAGRRVNRRIWDLLIAATALEHDFILATRNVRDYRDIPGLLIL